MFTCTYVIKLYDTVKKVQTEFIQEFWRFDLLLTIHLNQFVWSIIHLRLKKQ